MNSILNDLNEKIRNINLIYEYPNDKDFHQLKIPVIEYPSAKDNNFFNILRALVIRGTMSLSALANCYTDGDHPYDSVYQTCYRLLNGSDNINISLQQRELIIKKDRHFKLSAFGVLYAVHIFHMDKYYDDKHNQFTETDDFSYQKNVKGIFDLLKKNYNNYFPLFFDNLDYIKESEDLDINIFFDMINPNGSFYGHSFYNFYNPPTIDFSSQLENIIPFIFYHSSAISQMMNTKRTFKLDNSIGSKLSKISDNMLKKMKSDLELYSNVNLELF